MANKRQLKKQIRYICGDIAADVLIAGRLDEINAENVAKFIRAVANLQVESLANATFAFDKTRKDFENRAEYNKARTAYYRKGYDKLRANIFATVNEIVKEINAVLPAEVKAANVEAMKN
jgi:hypothetical protein